MIQKLRQQRVENAPAEARPHPVRQLPGWLCPSCRTTNPLALLRCPECDHASPQQPPSTFTAWIAVLWGLAIIGYFVIEVADKLDYMNKGARWGHIVALLFGGAMVIGGFSRIANANKHNHHR